MNTVTVKAVKKVSEQQQKTRQAIVDYISKHGYGVSRDFLDVSGDDDNNIRRALRYLVKFGYIESDGKLKTSGVGNPPTKWILKEKE